MNDELALKTLGLDREASPETVEKAYRKLINRYPPEFHPDKFRQIDEAYRYLTSYPKKIATLFAPDATRAAVDLTLFRYPEGEKTELLDTGIAELRRLARLWYLWEME